jgi:hypothetical protein
MKATWRTWAGTVISSEVQYPAPGKNTVVFVLSPKAL